MKDAVKSPCIQFCKLDDGVCLGCKRTKNQIANWLKYSDEERKCIMDRLNENNIKNYSQKSNNA